MKRVSVLLLGMAFAISGMAQSKNEKAVAQAVEELRQAMVDGNQAMLEKLLSDDLSYGHSGGHIDDKKEFVDKLVTGKSDFVTMELTEQTINIKGDLAIVRHKLDASTNDGGKPGDVHLLVLLVWQKQKGHWLLVARQAVKPS